VSFIVDASVALKWLLSNPDSDLAEHIAIGDAPLIVPTQLIAEASNTVWKRLPRGEVAGEQGCEAGIATALVQARHG
jgi:hypothetical protein